MSTAAPHVVFAGTVQRAGSAGYIELLFGPKEAFHDHDRRDGRAAVHRIRTSYREAAGLQGGERVDVRVSSTPRSAK